MYSDGVNELPLPDIDRPRGHPAEPWERFPCSEISDHGGDCCQLAREWLVAMDFAQLNGASPASGPRWLRAKYEWGPSAWPVHWCDIVARQVIDCGAHSALAHEVLTCRGLTAYRAQFVQRYTGAAMDQWRRKWTDEQVSDHWLGDEVIYHEGNALLVGTHELKLWDGSAGCWINPHQGSGYGSLAAVRILAAGRSPAEAFVWGEHRLKPNTWHALEEVSRRTAWSGNRVPLRVSGR